MKRILVVACLAIMLAGVGSSCAQPRFFAGGAYGRPYPPRSFYAPRPAFIVPPPVYIAPRPYLFAPRPVYGWGRGRGWRRGC